MLGIYLGAYRAFHPGFNLIYQDINGLRDLPGDMMNVDLSFYDFIIASPPCNAWSRSVSENRLSCYAKNTKHLLFDIIVKLSFLKKPFVVENVRNFKRFYSYGLVDFIKKNGLFMYFIGRHTYFTNVFLFDYEIDFLKNKQVSDNVVSRQSSDRQGGQNVHIVIDYFLHKFHSDKIIMRNLDY